MATRKKKPASDTPEPIFDKEGNEVEIVEEEEVDEDTLRALAELDTQNEIRWQIKRVSNPNTGYVETLSTAELSLERIATDCGPGKYQVRGIKADGKYYKSAVVTIAPVVRTSTPAGLSAPQGSGTDQMALLTLLLQNSQAAASEQTKVLTALIGKPSNQIPWAAIAAVGPALLKEAREFFAKPDKDDASMERVLKLVTIVEKLKGKDDGSGSTNWADVVREGLSQVSAVAAAKFGYGGSADTQPQVRQASAHVVTPHTSTALPSPVPMDAATASSEAVEPTLQMLGEQWLRGQLDTLVGAAANAKNPALRAELFVDELPKYIPESMVLSMLSADDWFVTLSTFDPRVTNYPAWFESLRDGIIETLKPTEDANDDDS